MVVAGVVSQDVDPTVVGHDLEIAMIRSEPAIEELVDLKASLVQIEALRCLLATVSGVALHPEAGRAGRIDAVILHLPDSVAPPVLDQVSELNLDR